MQKISPKLNAIVIKFQAITMTQIIMFTLLSGLVFLLLGSIAWLTRGDWIYPTQVQGSQQYALAENIFVGQSFVADEAGLEAIELKLNIQDILSIKLHPSSFQLWTAPPNDPMGLAKPVPIEAQNISLQADGWTRFSFKALPDSRRRYYYFSFQIPTSLPDGLTILAGSGDTYLNGAMYLEHYPVEGQLAFRLVHARQEMMLDILKTGLRIIPLGVVVLLFLTLPGIVLLYVLWPDHDFDSFSTLSLASGFTVAILPIIVLWAWVFGATLNAWFARSLLIFMGLICLYSLWKNKTRISTRYKLSSNSWQNIILFIVIGLVVLSRLWPLRYLNLPLWGDSYHHTMIVQLMMNNGGLFDNWQPYTFLSSFTYHFSFHTFCLFLSWLLNLSAAQAVLLGGQILNILAVLLLYPLAYYLSGKQVWAGIFAILAGGIISEMPAFYVNWGRYTQLTGQVVLPLTAIMTITLFKKPQWRIGLLAVLSVGGLLLAHYRVILMFASLALIWVGVDTLQQKPFWTNFRQRFLIGLLYLLCFTAIILPWLIRLNQGKLLSVGSQAAQSTLSFVLSWPALLDQLQESLHFVPPILIWLSVIILWFGLRKKFTAVLILFLWISALILTGKPYLLGLPGYGLVSNFAVQIALYIPFALTLGILFSAFLESLPIRWQQLSATLLFTILLVGFGNQQRHILDLSIHLMATPVDEQAAEWIEQNTPVNAVIYVDGFKAYSDTVVVGNDGGWWLPLLTNRQTTMPPISYAFEQAPDPTDKVTAFDLVDFGQNQSLSQDTSVDYLIEQGITHIYIGQQQGRVGNPGPSLFNPEVLQSNPRYHPIYHQDRVWIFALAGAGR